jgi:hypothetical protein
MAINRKKIIEDMSKLEIVGGANGLIEGFGVFVNQLPARFWNGFAARLTQKAPIDLLEATEGLLINAAHECGYHTGYGIITSDEWNAVVKPMVEKAPEDVLYGAFAVLAAWGWAATEVLTLDPGKHLLVRAYDYYERDAASLGKMPRPCAYMLRGICAAFMDLAYGGTYDKSGKTGIHTFTCQQTKGIECGDDYGEFVVTRA